MTKAQLNFIKKIYKNRYNKLYWGHPIKMFDKETDKEYVFYVPKNFDFDYDVLITQIINEDKFYKMVDSSYEFIELLEDTNKQKEIDIDLDFSLFLEQCCEDDDEDLFVFGIYET